MVKWNAEAHEKLLLLIAADVKVDHDSVAARWAKEYPNEKDRPNGRSIYLRLLALRKAAGAPLAAGPSKTNSTPRSTTKRAAPKTPGSSAKKARLSAMSEEDDSEDEEKFMDFGSPTVKREPSARSTKIRKSYVELDGEDDDNEDVDKPFASMKAYQAANEIPSPKLSTEESTPRTVHTPDEVAKTNKARSKKDPPNTAALAHLFSDDDDDSIYV